MEKVDLKLIPGDARPIDAGVAVIGAMPPLFRYVAYETEKPFKQLRIDDLYGKREH